MTMAAESPNAQIAPFGALRGLAIVVAAVVTLVALMDVPLLFSDFGVPGVPGMSEKKLVAAKQIAAPFIAGAAFVFALLGRIRLAVGTLAVLMLLAWASDLSTFPTGGFDIGFNATTTWTGAERVAFPLAAVAALTSAIRGTHLAVASVLVVLPAVMNVLGVVLFSAFDMQAFSL